MSILLTSCSCVHRIALDQNVILITLIVCCTLLATIAISLLFLYFKSNKRIALEKEKRKLEESLSKKADELLKEKERNKEVDSILLNEEKKKKDFLDYCYKMVEKGDEEQRKDCWKIILHIHADCIPDDLKQKYKGGKIVVENVGKTE